MNQQDTGSVIVGRLELLECRVPSIYPGYDETEFRVTVGYEHYFTGAKSQSFDSNSITYGLIFIY